MNGGNYGRGKAPERACSKLEDWPNLDRELWAAAIAATDPFADGGGTRTRHRPHSNRKVEKGYGRWLTFLKGRHLLHANVHPADRITLEEVKAYVAELQCLFNMKNSILCRLQELGDMARAISPERDWSFINRITAWVRAKKEAARDKRSRMVGSDELCGLGMTLMVEAATLSTPRLKAMAYRNGLIIALLSLRPIRRRNFVALTVGENLVRNGTGWAISIPGAATKNHVELEFDFPEQLWKPLETYLDFHRPILAKLVNRWSAPVGNRLWVSSQGSPMTEMAFYNMITKQTKRAFGRSINPHLFRDAAATTTAVHDPDHVRLAAPLLGHRGFATTERYYQQAQSLVASRTFTDMISKRRNEPFVTEQSQ